MNKLIMLVLVSIFSTANASVCDKQLQQIQYGQHTIDQLAHELKLQQLDIDSYTPSQRQSVEYTERTNTFDTLSVNYNAVVANHNHFVRQYKRRCEK